MAIRWQTREWQHLQVQAPGKQVRCQTLRRLKNVEYEVRLTMYVLGRSLNFLRLVKLHNAFLYKLRWSQLYRRTRLEDLALSKLELSGPFMAVER